MKTRLIVATVLSLGFLSAGAFAGQYDDQVNNRNSDYGVTETAAQVVKATHALQAIVVKKQGAIQVGDFIDETPEESHQRSSNR